MSEQKKPSFWQLVSPSGIISKVQYRRFLSRFRVLVIIGLCASLGVFITIALLTGFYKVFGTISHANPYIYVIAFILVFLSYCIRFFKWEYYTKKLKLKVSRVKNFIVYLSTNGMNITPGGIGSVIAAYTLKKITGQKFFKIVPIVTIDLFTDYFGFAIFALLAALYIGRYLLYVVILDILLVVPFALLIHPWLFKMLEARKKKGPLLKSIMRHAKNYYISQSVLNKPKVYLTSLCFTLPADILNSSALFFSLWALGIKPHFIKSTFIFSTSQILGMVSTLPGGIGAAEVTYITLLGSTLGLSTAIGTAATIMTRFATLWFGVIIGIVALVYATKYWENQRSMKNRRM